MNENTLREEARGKLDEILALIELKLLQLHSARAIRQSVEHDGATDLLCGLQREALEALAHDGEDRISASDFASHASRLDLALQCCNLPFVKGLPHDAVTVTHYCVTVDKAHGHGIFSAHSDAAEARYNAALTGGTVAAIDRREDGRIVEPHALRQARLIAAEYC